MKEGFAALFFVFVIIPLFIEANFPNLHLFHYLGIIIHSRAFEITVVSILFLTLFGFLAWLAWNILLFVTWPIRALFRHRPAPLPEIVPTSQWPFKQRWEYATKHTAESLSHIKEYTDKYVENCPQTVFSGMRAWAIERYLSSLKNDGELDAADNYVFLVLQRFVDELPDPFPAASYLSVPLSNLMTPRVDLKDAHLLYDVLVPYVIPQEIKYEGLWAPARPGSGKTNLLHCMIEDNMQEVAAAKASVFIMDSKSNDPNGLVDTWRSIEFEHEWGIKNVYYFQASDKLAINVFDLGDIDQIVPLFEYMLTDLIGDTLSGPQKAMLTNCLHVIKASDAPSILALSDLLSNGVAKYVQAIHKTRPHIQEYFLKPRTETFGRHNRSVTTFDSAQYRETKQGVLTRLHALLSFSDKLYDTLVSTKTTIDLRKLIDQGSVIIVNAKLSDLGSKGSELWQRWWTMMLLEAGRHRYSRNPLYIYFDEGHRGIARDTKVSEILEEMRAACFAVTIAHQGDWQIQDPSVLRSLQGLSAITLRATGERGVFNAKVYEKQLTLHVAQSNVRYRRRITGRDERKLHDATRETFSNTAAPPLVPLIEFIKDLPEPEIVYPEANQPTNAEAAEPEPEPFKYSKGPVIIDAEYEVIDDTSSPPPPPKALPPSPPRLPNRRPRGGRR